MRSLLAALLALACATGAHAHGGGGHTGFAARVSTIEPFLPGLIVTVLGGHERLSVTNLTEKKVVILDDRGRAFVRIPPRETKVWTEPRIGATAEPPEREGLVRNWLIRGTVDGEPFEITGFLGYRPAAGAAEQDGGSSGLPAWAIALAVAGGALVVVAALALPLRRREGKS